MTKPPFKLRGNRHAVLTRDGKFVISARSPFVWETYLLSRAGGVPGEYKIRADDLKVWHTLDVTIEEAEEQLVAWSKMFGRQKVARERKRRERRAERGLPVG